MEMGFLGYDDFRRHMHGYYVFDFARNIRSYYLAKEGMQSDFLRYWTV